MIRSHYITGEYEDTLRVWDTKGHEAVFVIKFTTGWEAYEAKTRFLADGFLELERLVSYLRQVCQERWADARTK